MNVGIVGLGKMGLLHAGILNSLDGVKITSVAENDKLISNYIKNSISYVNIYNDYKKMINSEDLDLVYITTPISTHVPIALRCIEKKINFFLEKPVSRNLEETQNLCAELKNSDVINAVGYNRRFVDTFAKAKSLLASKILGEINTVQSSMYGSDILSKSSGWRSKKKISGGGVLLDFGSHLIDLLLWYFGTIRKVSGKARSIYSKEVEDEAQMELEFDNGVVGKLEISWSKKGYRLPEINIEVIGNNGKLIISEDFIKVSLKSSVPELEKKEMTIFKQTLNTGVPIDIGGPDYTKEDMHMVECIKNKKQTLVNVFEASRTQSIIQAMYDSSLENEKKMVEYIG